MSKLIIIVIIVVIVAGTGWFIYSDIRSNTSSEDTILQQDNKIITKDGVGFTLSDGDISDIEVNQISSNDNIISDTAKNKLTYPSLGRVLVFQDSFPEDARIIIRNNIVTLTTQLQADSTSFNKWLDLATQYKIINDYDGAREVWEFLNILYPENSVSFSNLGDLYHFYLKDFPKAEENLLKAIKNNKQNTRAYISLHDLYKYSYKQDTTLATDILFEGLKENQNNTDLLVTLASYYKENEDIANAKKYYEQARDEAQKLENTQLVNLLEEEILNL